MRSTQSCNCPDRVTHYCLLVLFFGLLVAVRGVPLPDWYHALGLVVLGVFIGDTINDIRKFFNARREGR